MKLRTDYVSNSSSSSFIVIAKTGVDMTQTIPALFKNCTSEWQAYAVPNKHFKCQFGWEWETTSSFEGKLNFIGIQLLYLFLEKNESWKIPCKRKYTCKDFDKLYDMFKKVCLEKFNFHVKLNDDAIQTCILKDEKNSYRSYAGLNDDFYIDHQSASTEGRCMEMFESEDTLYDFLRFNESYVRGGNDNGADEDMM